MDRRYWGIHAKGDGAEEVLLGRHQLAIGWADLGDLSSFGHDRELLKTKLKEALPKAKPGAIPVYAGELYRFINELALGDVVVYRSTAQGTLHLGEVVGAYLYDPSGDVAHPNRRPVKWLKSLPVTSASLGALHELGSTLAFFQLENHAEEWGQLLAGGPTGSDDTDEVVALVSESSEQSTRDFVLKRLSAELKGHPFAQFVANLLQAMGYRTQVSPPGPDQGIDIVAHRGELGIEPPIIRVQVKSTEGGIGGPIVSELLGNLAPGEYGLIVTLGHYTPQARQKVKPHIRLIDGDDLVSLIPDHYEDLDTRYKAVIPLKRIYIPQAIED